MNVNRFTYCFLCFIFSLTIYSCNSTYQIESIVKESSLPLKTFAVRFYDHSDSLSSADKMFFKNTFESIMVKKGYKPSNDSVMADMILNAVFYFKQGYTDSMIVWDGRRSPYRYIRLPEPYFVSMIDIRMFNNKNQVLLMSAKNEINYNPSNQIPFAKYYMEVRGQLKAIFTEFPKSSYSK